MRHFYLFVLLIWPAWVAAETIQTLDTALREAFPLAASFVSETVQLSPDDKALVDRDLGRPAYDSKTLFATALGKDGAELGCAFLEDELGKHQPITFLVALDSLNRVNAVQLLTYREVQGGEIRSRRFRSQFVGKRFGDALRLNQDVDAVSGATISSSTIAFGVRRALYLRAKVTPFKLAGSMKERTP